MFNQVKKIDKALVIFFDRLGIPRLDQLDKILNRRWQGVKNYKIKDTRSIEVPVAFAMGFAITVLGSTISLMVLDVPEAAKDGLRLTTFISVVGLVCLGIHVGFKKILGDK